MYTKLQASHGYIPRVHNCLVLLCITLISCMVVFHFIFNISHGPPVSYLHVKKLRTLEEIVAQQE